MPPEEFRARGHEIIEWIASYLESVEDFPVLSRVAPGEITRALPRYPPANPAPFEQIMADFQDTIIPGIAHWNHPGFFAYFGISGAGPGVLGEAITAALNVNAMLWRTSPAATELEEVALAWLREMVGLPQQFRGHVQDTASTSTMVALGAAREAAGLDVRREGLAGRVLPRLRIYASEEAHSSVDRAAITLGLGTTGVRKVSTDASLRMDPAALAEAIRTDRADGVRPIAVVATIGTTSTTSVDPVAEIADICDAESLWLHVDAAYGGAAAILPELRSLMYGWERSDSIVINPHKWLFVPLDCSALFVRDTEVVRRAFSAVPEYLTTPEDGSVTNLMDNGPALGRRFRALKLWMTLRYFGVTGIADRLREHLRLARLFTNWVGDADDWEILAPVQFSTVCFRYHPSDSGPQEIDKLNEQILERVNQSGNVFLSHTRIAGRFALRLAVGNIRTQERHVELAWQELRAAAATGAA